MFGWGSPAAKPNAKRGYFSMPQMPQMPQLSNPFARSLPVVQQPLMQGNPVEDYYSHPVVQQPIAIPVPVQVPVARNSTGNSKFNELHSKYDDLENERFNYKKKYNSKKRYNKVPTAENEAAVKKATDDVEQFLRSLPPDSINYISEYDGNLLSGISFLSIACRYMSSTGIKILCEMGAKTDIIDDSGRSLAEAADADAKRLKKMGLDPTEFITTVKQCTALKGGRRSVRGTKKVRRKRRYASRRR